MNDREDPSKGSPQKAVQHRSKCVTASVLIGVALLCLVVLSKNTGVLSHLNNAMEQPASEFTTFAAGRPQNYFFAQTWSAGFCRRHLTMPGCASPTASMESHLTIHGLWPEGYPNSICSDKDLTIADVNTLLRNRNFVNYYVSEQTPLVSDGHGGWRLQNNNALQRTLWWHEWDAHGRCSGLSAVGYFTRVVALAVAFDDTNEASPLPPQGNTVAYQDLVDYYGQGKENWVVLQCDAATHDLTEICTCFNVNIKQFACDAHYYNHGNAKDHEICEPDAKGNIRIRSF